jgi:hypothetical protein
VLVYRLIPVWRCEVVNGAWEFESGAFDNASSEHEHESRDDMSVVLGDTLAASQRVPEALPWETSWAGDDWGRGRPGGRLPAPPGGAGAAPHPDR